MYKRFIPLFILSITVIPAMGQSSARIFTYDAGGNRISMGLPLLRLPQKAPDESISHEEAPLTITSQPDGKVQLTVRHNDPQRKYSAMVYTTSGKRVATLPPTSRPLSVIDLSALQPGVYLVDVAIDGSHVSQKVVKE